MTTAKPGTEAAPKTAAIQPATAPTYVAGSHAGRVRAEHDARRTELLARDEVLASEIAAREAERHDINEALNLMSAPAPQISNVVPLNSGAAE